MADYVKREKAIEAAIARCGKPNYYKVTHWIPIPEPPEVE